MASYNKVVLVGNLTRDPELRYMPSGDPVARFGLAVNRTYVGRDNQKKEEVAYINVTSFGKTAETVSKYCQKGSGILVDGHLNYNSWEEPGGKKRSALDVVMERLHFLGRRLAPSPTGTGPDVPVMQDASSAPIPPEMGAESAAEGTAAHGGPDPF